MLDQKLFAFQLICFPCMHKYTLHVEPATTVKGCDQRSPNMCAMTVAQCADSSYQTAHDPPSSPPPPFSPSPPLAQAENQMQTCTLQLYAGSPTAAASHGSSVLKSITSHEMSSLSWHMLACAPDSMLKYCCANWICSNCHHPCCSSRRQITHHRHERHC